MTQLTIAETYNLALQHHQAGRLRDAEQLYTEVLAQQPDHPDALHLLGLIAYQAGRHDEAANLIARALTFRPEWPEALCNLGNALHAAGQLDQAITAYRHAIAIKPNLAQAHNNLGNVLNKKGQLDEAIAAYRHAIVLKPNYREAHNGLGIVLQAKGLLEQAIAAYRHALALKPDSPETHYNLGSALHATGHSDEAITAYRQALALKPDWPEAHYNLGNVLQAKGNLDDAIAAYRQALALKPSYPEALNNLGNVLQDKDQLAEAVAAYRQALVVCPSSADAYHNLSTALRAQWRLDEAIAASRQAIALKPDFSEAHSSLVGSLHYHPGFDAPAIFEELRRWNQQHAEPLKKHIAPHANDRSPDRRLRIGYVSPDLRDHVVARFLLPLLEHHDPRNVEVFAYAQVPRPDAITERLRSYTDAWHSLVGLSDAQAADLIRQDGVDILMDLALHTAGNRLLVFARKPAPVQVTYLAYAGSSGLSTMDYRLSDPYLDPPGGDESVYSERTIRLPETYWCYQPVLEPPLQAAPALQKGFITFGCLNNLRKINQPLLSLWACILGAVRGSRLLLHANEGGHRQEVLDQLQRQGIEPHRVSFAGTKPIAAYFQLYHSIDIALDTFPYGGGTTTCDALWMGVPVVSLAGKTAVGRGGLSILSNVGMPELVAHTPQQYLQIAVDLANDPARLKNLRATLRRRMAASPLMDAPKFARNIEAAYRQMWRTWTAQAGAPANPTPP